jgi:hypothetical protein
VLKLGDEEEVHFGKVAWPIVPEPEEGEEGIHTGD